MDELDPTAPSVVETPVLESQPAIPVVETPEAPKTIQEAIEREFTRDPVTGRFAQKDAEVTPPAATATPGTPAVAAAAGTPPAPKPEDKYATPEGSTEKAASRWQALANENRELTQRADTAERQVTYVREQFQTHGITQPQFEQAAQFIGAINKGDYVSAKRVLIEQAQQLSLLTGENFGAQVDPLANFPDLRQQVDNLQVTEPHALELARHRQREQTQATQRQQAEVRQREEQSGQQAFAVAQNAVDAFCRKKAGEDIDYPAIEAQLLPRIKDLLQDVPPTSWARIVEMQYDLLKGAASKFRKPAPTADMNALRPAAGGSVVNQPRTIEDAIRAKLGIPASA